MSSNVPVAQATMQEAVRVQEALGELVGAAKEGLLASASASGWACYVPTRAHT